jgi:hypothetical protein
MRGTTVATAWAASNLALYMPFEVNEIVTAYQIAFVVTTQSGNLDVGIYDHIGNRLVSKGSTAVAVAGVQVVDITDTTLPPGAYFLAMCVDNTTAAFTAYAVAALVQQSVGMQQQAVGAVTLPNPATFANPANTIIPAIWVSTLKATI